jgi:hypothetical protein
MSAFPGSPQVTRGLILGIDPFNPVASIVRFQYNPDTMTRTLTARGAGDGAAQGEMLHLKGPPREEIGIEIELDATDKLATGDALTAANGITPQLAALEMLIYPKSSLAIANEVLNAVGMVEIIPAAAPLTIFAWGPRRSVPVRIDGMTITEQAFDPGLNPIQANVKLDMTVLTYQDLGLLSAGGALFMTYQVQKEVLATIASLGG